MSICSFYIPLRPLSPVFLLAIFGYFTGCRPATATTDSTVAIRLRHKRDSSEEAVDEGKKKEGPNSCPAKFLSSELIEKMMWTACEIS
jgi:hypothetical protein